MNIEARLPASTGNPAPSGGAGRVWKTSVPHSLRPEVWVFAGLIAVFSGSVFFGSAWHTMMFEPAAVRAGEWWRLLTHPFVHLTWCHLLLDASAFLLLYQGLLAPRFAQRLGFVLASATGSLLLAWLANPSISNSGLCGLSGIAHGLTAISAVEMMLVSPAGKAEWRLGCLTLLIVVAKGAFEAISGHVLFESWYFGMMGTPVTASHGGGIAGGLAAMLLQKGRYSFRDRVAI